MPKTILMEGLRTRYRRNGFFFFWIPLLISFGILIAGAKYQGGLGSMFWVGSLVFSGSLAVGAVLHRIMLRGFQCPRCRRYLPYAHRKSGEKITYLCAHCDTIWDTGLTEPRYYS
jgi:hypothetical protein